MAGSHLDIANFLQDWSVGRPDYGLGMITGGAMCGEEAITMSLTLPDFLPVHSLSFLARVLQCSSLNTNALHSKVL